MSHSGTLVCLIDWASLKRRAKFQPDLYHKPSPDGSTKNQGLISRTFKRTKGVVPPKNEEEETANVLEVWFSGCHSGALQFVLEIAPLNQKF